MLRLCISTANICKHHAIVGKHLENTSGVQPCSTIQSIITLGPVPEPEHLGCPTTLYNPVHHYLGPGIRARTPQVSIHPLQSNPSLPWARCPSQNTSGVHPPSTILSIITLGPVSEQEHLRCPTTHYNPIHHYLGPGARASDGHALLEAA